MMIGWRGRVGMLVPSVNIVVEPEMAQMAPPGVAVYAARMGLDDSTELAGVHDLATNAEVAARDLSAAGVGAIGFACTTASFHAGLAAERRLSKNLASVSRAPVVTAISAVVEAIRCLGVHKVAMATPYSERVNKLATDFLNECDIEVVSAAALGVVDTAAIGFVGSSDVYTAAKSAAHADAQALFLSCTNLSTVSLIESLEADLGMPVVSSNQALLWAVLGRIGVRATLTGHGTLMEHVDWSESDVTSLEARDRRD